MIGTVLAIYGHDWLHRVFQVLFWVSLPFWVVLTIGIVTGHAGGQAAAPTEMTVAGFLGMFTVAASYNITYAPYVSDYSRYLPTRHEGERRSSTSVFLGAAGSPIWLIPLGAWLGSALGVSDPLLGHLHGGQQRRRRSRRDPRRALGARARRDDGPQRLQRHAHDRDRRSTRCAR